MKIVLLISLLWCSISFAENTKKSSKIEHSYHENGCDVDIGVDTTEKTIDVYLRGLKNAPPEFKVRVTKKKKLLEEVTTPIVTNSGGFAVYQGRYKKLTDKDLQGSEFSIEPTLSTLLKNQTP